MRLLRTFVLSSAFTVVIAIAALVPLGRGDGITVEAAGPCGIPGFEVDQDAEEQAFLALINAYRAENSLPPLTVSYTLSRASAWKSRHLGENAYFAHDDTPIARGWSTRVRDCGYSYNAYIGENIAAGYGTAASVFEGWRNSPGHNSNMLGSNYTTIGIGRVVVSGSPYGTYWTTVFGSYADGWAEAYSGEQITPIDDGVPYVAPSIAESAALPRAGGSGDIAHRALAFDGFCERLLQRRADAHARLCTGD